jgi:hypothetical protein
MVQPRALEQGHAEKMGGALASYGIFSGPMQTDIGHPNWLKNDPDWEKPSPAARRILTGLLAVTQTRPKFGHGLRRPS